MIVKLRNRKIKINVEKVSFLGKFIGLMFHSRNTENLLFDFERYEKAAIHSFFVFFPFIALWLDDKNNILEFGIVRPFTFLIKPRSKVSRLVEVPINDKNRKIIKIIVGKGKI